MPHVPIHRLISLPQVNGVDEMIIFASKSGSKRSEGKEKDNNPSRTFKNMVVARVRTIPERWKDEDEDESEDQRRLARMGSGGRGMSGK